MPEPSGYVGHSFATQEHLAGTEVGNFPVGGGYERSEYLDPGFQGPQVRGYWENPSNVAAHYNAIKAALIRHGSGLAQALAPQGVRVNTVSPGPIFIEGGDWNMIKDHMADFYAATAKAHPGGELGTAQDVADVIAFLASDRARHVNGVNVTVDGGFLKRVDF